MRKTPRARRGQGFTLLELLMVVIILAILASIALPQYLKTTERARAAEALGILSSMRSSQLRFRAQSTDGTSFATSPANLDVDVPGFGNTAASNLWDYSTDGTVARATRNSGTETGSIEIVLDTGVVCTDNINAWGGTPCGPASGP